LQILINKFNTNKNVQKSVVQAKNGKDFVNEQTCPYLEKFCHAAIHRCTPDFARSQI